MILDLNGGFACLRTATSWKPVQWLLTTVKHV